MFNRRSFFKKLGLGTFSSFITLQTLHGKPCNRLVTPDQPLGPFYPNKIPLENDADLTKLKGHIIFINRNSLLIILIVQ